MESSESMSPGGTVPTEQPQPVPLPTLKGVLAQVQARASESLQDGLMARGATEREVEQVVSFSVRVAAEHRLGPALDWTGLSLNGQRVGLRDSVGVMWDFAVGDALRRSAREHLEQALEVGRSKAAAPVPIARAAPSQAAIGAPGAPGVAGGAAP